MENEILNVNYGGVIGKAIKFTTLKAVNAFLKDTPWSVRINPQKELRAAGINYVVMDGNNF